MPYWKATNWQEKISDLFIIVMTADITLIKQDQKYLLQDREENQKVKSNQIKSKNHFWFHNIFSWYGIELFKR